MVSLPYPKGNDRATVVKDFAHFVETRTDSVPLKPLLVDAARYLQETEDLRAPAAAAADDLHGCRAVLAMIIGHSNSEISAKVAKAVEILRRVAGRDQTATGSQADATADLDGGRRATVNPVDGLLVGYANAVGMFEPKWVVKEPGVRVLTGTSFEMRISRDYDRIQVYMSGGRIAGPFSTCENAEQAVDIYINNNRERLVAFGFIGQETRT